MGIHIAQGKSGSLTTRTAAAPILTFHDAVFNSDRTLLPEQLREAFPVDKITEIAKGIRGADISQEVKSKTGRTCGMILYENKRAKNWSDGWIAKLKEDMLEKKADIGVIVTEALPPNTEMFCSKDEIWITDPKTAIPLVHVLRCLLQEVTIARGHRDGAKERMEILYDYLNGKEFRRRVSSVIDAFKAMHRDLQVEKRSLQKHWSKREKHINSVIENMAAMVGDVRAISGNVLQQIPAPSSLIPANRTNSVSDK